METLRRALKEEDDALRHAEIRVSIAKRYMSRNDYERAKPDADEAAKTGAAWAMIAAAYREEGLGNFDRAEEWMKAVSHRYDNQPEVWYFWCLRTGRGDAVSAKKFLVDAIANRGDQLGVADLLYHSILLEGVGKEAEAAKQYQELAARTGYLFYYLIAYARYDALMATQSRDRLYEKIPHDMIAISPVLVLLHSHAKLGGRSVPTQKELDQALEKTKEGELTETFFLVASFLKMRSEPDLAKAYLAKIPPIYEAGAVVPIFAAALSRELAKR